MSDDFSRKINEYNKIIIKIIILIINLQNNNKIKIIKKNKILIILV